MYCQDQDSTLTINIFLINIANNTSKDFKCTVPFLSGTRQLRLNEALQYTCQRVMPLHGSQLFYVDFENRVNRYLGVYPIKEEIRISYQGIVNMSVQINIKPQYVYNPSPACVIKQQDLTFLENTNKKVKQRTIQQALDAVSIWRKLYDTDDGEGKRLYTLQQSANQVGIAKKTLDDYYNLIRYASSLNFNYDKYKVYKVGILRKFVKIAKQEGQEGLNSKMPGYQYDLDIQKYWNIDDL